MKQPPLIVVIFVVSLTILVFFKIEKDKKAKRISDTPIEYHNENLNPPPHTEEDKPDPGFELKNAFPKEEMDYASIVALLQEWNATAPEITEVGTYGNSGNGTPLHYIRMGNKNGKKVLITSGIHGNEKLGVATSIACIGLILEEFGRPDRDPRYTEMLKNRDIFFIPVVCPDGYAANTRHEGGLDPNRDWLTQNQQEKNSIPSIAALKNFYHEHKFSAIMSVHNYGELFMYPWGYTRETTNIDSEYISILNEMAKTSGYEVSKLYGRSGPPYFGYECDWYHKQGAFSIVNEIGTSFSAPTERIVESVAKNWEAFVIFIEKAPQVRGGQF